MERWNAVVVGQLDVGEASRIVRLLSAEAGRSAVMARGARTSRRRFGGLDIGVRAIVEVRKGRGELPVLASAETVRAPARARDDLLRIAWLAYGCELCASLAPEHERAPKLHGLLCAWLDRLEADEIGTAARAALEVKALAFAGFSPALVRCARCGRPIGDPARFDPDAGGMVHDGCGGGTRVPADAARAVDRLLHTSLADVRGDVPPGFPGLLADFACHHLAHGLRSRALADEWAGVVGAHGAR
jgi:DNA repair protein RecO (recombination protein O)